MVLLDREFLFFYFSILNMDFLFHCFRWKANNYIVALLYSVMSSFYLAAFLILSYVFGTLTVVCLCRSFCIFPTWDLLSFSSVYINILNKYWMFLVIISKDIPFVPLSLPFPSGISIMKMLIHMIIFHRFLRLCGFFVCLFFVPSFFIFLSWIISV